MYMYVHVCMYVERLMHWYIVVYFVLLQQLGCVNEVHDNRSLARQKNCLLMGACCSLQMSRNDKHEARKVLIVLNKL